GGRGSDVAWRNGNRLGVRNKLALRLQPRWLYDLHAETNRTDEERGHPLVTRQRWRPRQNLPPTDDTTAPLQLQYRKPRSRVPEIESRAIPTNPGSLGQPLFVV